jgi:hypothetical protein
VSIYYTCQRLLPQRNFFLFPSPTVKTPRDSAYDVTLAERRAAVYRSSSKKDAVLPDLYTWWGHHYTRSKVGHVHEFKAYRGVEVINIHSFINSALYREGSTPRPGQFTQRKSPGSHWIGCWLSTTARLDDLLYNTYNFSVKLLHLSWVKIFSRIRLLLVRHSWFILNVFIMNHGLPNCSH